MTDSEAAENPLAPVTLDSRLANVVGGKTAVALGKAFGVDTVGDLLSHYPRRYARRGELSSISLLPLDENVTIVAEIRLDSQGLKGFNVSVWHGMYAPKGTPKPVLDMVNTALKNALKDPEFIKRQEALGAVIVTDNRTNPADHKRFVEAEINKWGPAIKAAGQYAD